MEELSEKKALADEALFKTTAEIKDLEYICKLGSEVEYAQLELIKILYKEIDYKNELIYNIIDNFKQKQQELEQNKQIIHKLKNEIYSNAQDKVIANTSIDEYELLNYKKKYSSCRLEKQKLESHIDLLKLDMKENVSNFAFIDSLPYLSDSINYKAYYCFSLSNTILQKCDIYIDQTKKLLDDSTEHKNSLDLCNNCFSVIEIKFICSKIKLLTGTARGFLLLFGID